MLFVRVAVLNMIFRCLFFILLLLIVFVFFPFALRAKFCWPGNQMFPQLDRELRFGYQRNGSLVLATTEGEVRHLYELKERGEKNGVQNLRVLSKDETRAMEPKVSDDVIGALYAPDAGKEPSRLCFLVNRIAFL